MIEKSGGPGSAQYGIDWNERDAMAGDDLDLENRLMDTGYAPGDQ